MGGMDVGEDTLQKALKINLDPRTDTVDKCSLCYHRITRGLTTACCEACPTGARVFVWDLASDTGVPVIGAAIMEDPREPAWRRGRRRRNRRCRPARWR